MDQKKLPLLVFLLVVAAIVSVSVTFGLIAVGTPVETWVSLGYPVAFALGLIGAASIVIPVPTTFVLLGMATSTAFDKNALALAFGVGAAIGQLSSYVVGYLGREVVSEKYNRRMNAMLKVFQRYGMVAVFIFALTPLPDSLIFIPMGLAHYSLWRLFVAALAGKIAMSLIITHVGGAVGGAFAENWMFAAAMTILLVLMTIAIFRIDWEKVVKKYLPAEKRKE